MLAQRAYGIRLETEIPIEGLPAASGDELGCVQVLDALFPAARPFVPDAETLVDGRPLTFYVNGGIEICWEDVVSFHLNVGNSVIRCAAGSEGGPRQVREWLLQYALPLFLQTEHRLLFLHGGGVQIGDRAVGFLAASRGGKSTLVEHFVRQGHAFLTDDKLALLASVSGFDAVPGTPFFRRGHAKAQWQYVSDFAPAPLPLGTLYLLVPADPASTPEITPLPPREVPFALAARCELRLPNRVRERLQLPPHALESFQDCSELARVVRVCRLRVPRDHARLPEVHAAVLADAGV